MVKLAVDVFQVCGLSSPAWAVIDDFDLDFFFFQIDECHSMTLSAN
jgi:hypothetical protein